MGVMMAPSVLGIFTDIVGIFLIAIAPIPAMERFALFCGFWAIWLIPTGVVLISLLLASLPAPKNVDKLVGEGAKASGFQRRSEEHTSELQSLMRTSYAVFCLKKKNHTPIILHLHIYMIYLLLI